MINTNIENESLWAHWSPVKTESIGIKLLF